MSVINRGMSNAVIDLAAGPSARILERAERVQAGIAVEFKSGPPAAIPIGRLVAATGDVLTVAIEGDCPPDLLPSACADATLRLDAQEYMFATHVRDVRNRGDSTEVDLVRPKVVQTWQRRRFVRATVADSARVQFGRPDKPSVHLFEGDMLNVSQDGLACRVRALDADRFTIDDDLGVTFALHAYDEPLQLVAKVKSKVPGGSPGAIIMGMQFRKTAADRAQHARLVETLESYL